VDSLTFLQSRQKWAEHWLGKASEESGPEADRRVEQYRQLKEGYAQATAEIRDLRSRTKPIPRDLGDISDLPPELLQELSSVKTDTIEDQLVTIINSLGGTADLDQILVGLYRRFDVLQTRRFIQNKLWRMNQKYCVWTVPKKKGVYTTEPPDGDWGKTPTPRRKEREPVDDLDDEIPF
jgi:hypothetical protein